MTDRITRKLPPTCSPVKLRGGLPHTMIQNDPDFLEGQGKTRTWSRRSSGDSATWSWPRTASGRETQINASGSSAPSQTTAAETATEGQQRACYDYSKQQARYWAEAFAALEIDIIAMPETHRRLKRGWEDLGAYFAGCPKQRSIELTERKMTESEREPNAFQTLPEQEST